MPGALPPAPPPPPRGAAAGIKCPASRYLEVMNGGGGPGVLSVLLTPANQENTEVGHSRASRLRDYKVDISLRSHNRIHGVRAWVNIVRTRGPIAAGVCAVMERDCHLCVFVHALRVLVHFDMNHSHKNFCVLH